MADILMLLLQATTPAPDAGSPGFWGRLWEFIDTPAPYSPFSEYLLLLFVLWLIARRHHRRRESFDAQAQEVLDEKYAKGELSQNAYDKYRQDVSVRPKR